MSKRTESAKASYAKYAKSPKGKARAALGHKRYYAKPEKRAKMLAANKRWHATHKRGPKVWYPRFIRKLQRALSALKQEISKHEKQD